MLTAWRAYRSRLTRALLPALAITHAATSITLARRAQWWCIAMTARRSCGISPDGVNVITSYGYPVKYKGGFRYKAVISVRGPVLLTADPHFELEGNMDDMVCSEDYEDADDYEDYAAAALAYDYYYADYSFAPFAYDIRGYEYDVVDNPYSYPPACEGRRSVSCSDWLQWVDGYQYCGRYAPPNVFVQENASVAIEFQSDGSVAGSGFSFNCTRCPDG